MFVPFESLAGQSRIWIYQASRAWTEDEERMICGTVRSFCDQWTAHGQSLKTSFKVEYRQFLILAVDEDFNGASGCSIDGSVQVIRDLQNQSGIDLLDRSKVAFLVEGKVTLVAVKELKAAFSSGTLNPAIPTFNTQVLTKAAMDNDWIVQAGKTWLTKYLPNPAVV